MIAANEVRLGNWVNIPECCINAKLRTIGASFQIDITEVDLDESDNCFYSHSICPIPLTPAILELAGFEKRPDNNYWLFKFDTDNDCFFDIATMTAKVGEITLSLPLLYVHSLQNYYFAAMQEELIIQL